MRNAKTAIDGVLPLQRDFYADDHLRKFFGGDEIEWGQTEKNPTRIWGWIYDFRAITKSTHLSEGVSLRFRYTVETDGSRDVVLSFRFTNQSPERPTFFDIERLFGKGWVQEDYVPSPHRKFIEPTALHGNDHIIYHYLVGTSPVEIRFTFAFDGMVEAASFWMKDPEK